MNLTHGQIKLIFDRISNIEKMLRHVRPKDKPIKEAVEELRHTIGALYIQSLQENE